MGIGSLDIGRHFGSQFCNLSGSFFTNERIDAKSDSRERECKKSDKGRGQAQN